MSELTQTMIAVVGGYSLGSAMCGLSVRASALIGLALALILLVSALRDFRCR